MSKIANSVVLITGGASGIGRLLAIECAIKKASCVIILDINEVGAVSVCDEIKDHGAETYFIKTDLSLTASVREAITKVYKLVESVDILVNNAGIVVGKAFHDHTDEEIIKTINVNLNALMLLTKGLLPAMIEKKQGHIVNIASSAGMAAFPKLAVYTASKWGVIGWSESLRLEMESGSTGIKVTTVTPYLIDTGMFDGVRSPIIPLLKPSKVVEGIIRSIEKNSIYSRMPGIVYAIPFFKGIMPQRWFDVVIGKIFRIYSAMDTFKGRK